MYLLIVATIFFIFVLILFIMLIKEVGRLSDVKEACIEDCIRYNLKHKCFYGGCCVC